MVYLSGSELSSPRRCVFSVTRQYGRLGAPTAFQVLPSHGPWAMRTAGSSGWNGEASDADGGGS